MELTFDLLKQILPTCQDPGQWVDPLNQAMARFDIDSERRAACFIAQAAQESGCLNRLEENLNYSAERLVQVWPKRFQNIDDVARNYEHAPEKLANFVYANRLGNGDEQSGDGWRFRGRGIFQLTGRANYANAAAALANPYDDEPDLLLTPGHAALTAAWFWSTKGLNDLADDDDNFSTITERINGALTGDTQRRQYWSQARAAFDVA